MSWPVLVSVTSPRSIRRLATLDLGIAMLAEEIVAEDLAEGRLRRVRPRWQATPISVYAITETRLLPAKTQRFIEFLRECLKQQAPVPLRPGGDRGA